jgi:hypothetical protein
MFGMRFVELHEFTGGKHPNIKPPGERRRISGSILCPNSVRNCASGIPREARNALSPISIA